MAETDPALPFLFTVTVTDTGGEPWEHRSFLAYGDTVWSAWTLQGRRQAMSYLADVQADQDEFAPAGRLVIGSVQAISCEEDFAALFASEQGSGAPWEEDLLRERGARLVGADGAVLRRWRDRGPLQVRHVVTVLEYRALLPGSAGMYDDPVRWSDVEVDCALAAGDRMPLLGEEPADRFDRGDGAVDGGGVTRPGWIAPGSEGYDGESRYLVRWVFSVADYVDVEQLRARAGDGLSEELLEMTGDVGEDLLEAQEAPDVVEVLMQSAREGLLQALLERSWRPAAPEAAAPEAPAPLDASVSGFTMFLPYDPRTISQMLPGPDRHIGQITQVVLTTVAATDYLEWPGLAGFTGQRGYRVTCEVGIPDAVQWTRQPGVWSRLTERLRQARAAAALAHLESLVTAADAVPRTDPPADVTEVLADLRTADGHGRLYVLTAGGKVVLLEHGLAGTTGWVLPGLKAKTVRELAGDQDDPWLPRITDPVLYSPERPELR